MPEFVEIEGLAPLVRGLEQFDDTIQDELAQELTPLMEGIGRKLATYPAELPGQRYERTGELGQGWATPTVVERATNRIRFRKTNRTRYGPFVQGRQQARVHRGRWPTTDQAMDESRGELEQAATRAARRALTRIRR